MDNVYEMTLLFNSQMERIADVCKQLDEKGSQELFKASEEYETQPIVLTFDNIKDYLDTQSRSFKRFVVFNYSDKFVIMRLIDNSDTKAIYRFMFAEQEGQQQETIKGEPNDDSQRRYLKVIKLAERYKSSTLEKVQKIDAKITRSMFADGVIPYGWFQRNTSTSPAFKKTGNPTQALKDTLWAMIDKGTAEIIDGEKYGTGAKLYKVSTISAKLERKESKEIHIIEESPQKLSELAYIENLLPALQVLGREELEITDKIAVTYLDIRCHLNKLSQGVKRFGVIQEPGLFRIVRQMDETDMTLFYKDADQEALEKMNGAKKHKESGGCIGKSESKPEGNQEPIDVPIPKSW